MRDNYRQEGLNASSEEQQGRHRDNILIIVSFRAMDLSIIYDRLSLLELCLCILGIRMNRTVFRHLIFTGTGTGTGTGSKKPRKNNYFLLGS